jgi:hypothetical protein
MRGEIIHISSVSRSAVRSTDYDRFLTGFNKALALIHMLNRKSATDARATVESMVMEGAISKGERKAVAEFFGWERGS